MYCVYVYTHVYCVYCACYFFAPCKHVRMKILINIFIHIYTLLYRMSKIPISLPHQYTFATASAYLAFALGIHTYVYILHMYTVCVLYIVYTLNIVYHIQTYYSVHIRHMCSILLYSLILHIYTYAYTYIGSFITLSRRDPLVGLTFAWALAAVADRTKNQPEVDLPPLAQEALFTTEKFLSSLLIGIAIIAPYSNVIYEYIASSVAAGQDKWQNIIA